MFKGCYFTRSNVRQVDLTMMDLTAARSKGGKDKSKIKKTRNECGTAKAETNRI